jgi:TusE/DsrC/DsvC family sulfur relay protein
VCAIIARSEWIITNKEEQMPEIDVRGKKVELNPEGFMVNPEEWDEEVAVALAKSEEGIESLTQDHWAVVHYIRDYYLEKNLAPMVRKVCKNTGFPLKYIFELFPSGPAKGACKVAGLPKPDGCV